MGQCLLVVGRAEQRLHHEEVHGPVPDRVVQVHRLAGRHMRAQRRRFLFEGSEIRRAPGNHDARVDEVTGRIQQPDDRHQPDDSSCLQRH